MTKLPADAKVELVERLRRKLSLAEMIGNPVELGQSDVRFILAALEQSDAEQGEDAKSDDICAACGEPIDFRPGESFMASVSGKVWHMGCAQSRAHTPQVDKG